jgi:hypothetical protein
MVCAVGVAVIEKSLTIWVRLEDVLPLKLPSMLV